MKARVILVSVLTGLLLLVLASLATIDFQSDASGPVLHAATAASLAAPASGPLLSHAVSRSGRSGLIAFENVSVRQPITAPTAVGTPTSTPTAYISPTPTCLSVPAAWTPAPTIPAPGRYNAGGVVAGDGRFYVEGGADSSNLEVANNDAFDPNSNTWSSLPPLPTPRANPAVGSLGGTVYVSGGNLHDGTFLSEFDAYDVAAGSWTHLANMPTPLTGAMGWGLESTGKYYVFGGDSGPNANSAATYFYDPVAGAWTAGADMPGFKSFGGEAEWDGKIYLFGGYDGTTLSASLFQYDPRTNTWATLPAAPNTRFRPGVSARDGKIYATGGGLDPGNPYDPSATVDIFDIAASSWVEGPTMLEPRVGHVEGTLPDGRIIAATGIITAAFRTRDAEVLAAGEPCPQQTPTVTATPTTCTINFSDVQTSDWFYDYIRCLYCRGAISGYSDGTFRPYNNTTRGQLTKIVVLGFAMQINTTGGPHFTDVPATDPFYQYIETAYNAHVISGYADGTFRPGANVTRGQLSKIVVTAADWLLIDAQSPTFTDVPVGSPFYDYVETAVCHQVITGYNDGTFRPGNNATRAQISKIVCLSVENQNPCGGPTPTPTATAVTGP